MTHRIFPRPVGTPLCPAGHLSLKGGDRKKGCRSPSTRLLGREECIHGNIISVNTVFCRDLSGGGNPISPLEGEMVGRPEGGGHAPQRSKTVSVSSANGGLR